MNDYLVLLAYEHYNIGDTVSLNDRQAKYLLTAGLIKPKPRPEPKKPKETN